MRSDTAGNPYTYCRGLGLGKDRILKVGGLPSLNCVPKDWFENLSKQVLSKGVFINLQCFLLMDLEW